MTLALVFAGTLLAAVLISGRAERTVLSTAVVFLAVGFLAEAGGVLSVRPESTLVTRLAEVALFAVLFTDGMRCGVRELTAAWSLPGRALLLGLPLTLALTALFAHFVVGLPWVESFLLGAILSPTDPVFASALIGREEVPDRLRFLLNVESGVNDGLVLPAVLILLAVAPPSSEAGYATLAGELLLGIALGVVVPWIALRLERLGAFDLSPSYEPLYALSVGLLVLSLAYVTHANLFLAAFSAGVTVVSVYPQFRDAFHQLGDHLAELLKLLAILVFGALITPSLLAEIGLGGYLFVVLVIFVARPLALLVAFLGSTFAGRELAAAAWFGPKGFASVVYGLLVLQSGIVGSEQIFHLVAVVVAVSIVLHSSTDVLIARRFSEAEPR